MTFDVPFGEDTGESDAFAPGEDVIEIALAGRHRRSLTTFAGCGSDLPASNPNPGFGVVPAAAAGTRRIIDERRDQVGRDVSSLRSTTSSKAKKSKAKTKKRPKR